MSENYYLNEEYQNYQVSITKSDPEHNGNTTIEVIFPNAAEMLGEGWSIEEAIIDLLDSLIKALSSNDA